MLILSHPHPHHVPSLAISLSAITSHYLLIFCTEQWGVPRKVSLHSTHININKYNIYIYIYNMLIYTQVNHTRAAFRMPSNRKRVKGHNTFFWTSGRSRCRRGQQVVILEETLEAIMHKRFSFSSAACLPPYCLIWTLWGAISQSSFDPVSPFGALHTLGHCITSLASVNLSPTVLHYPNVS